MLDSNDINMAKNISKEDTPNIEEETHDDECTVGTLDEHEMDDYAMVARYNEAKTDWEGQSC